MKTVKHPTHSTPAPHRARSWRAPTRHPLPTLTRSVDWCCRERKTRLRRLRPVHLYSTSDREARRIAALDSWGLPAADLLGGRCAGQWRTDRRAGTAGRTGDADTGHAANDPRPRAKNPGKRERTAGLLPAARALGLASTGPPVAHCCRFPPPLIGGPAVWISHDATRPWPAASAAGDGLAPAALSPAWPCLTGPGEVAPGPQTTR